MHRPGRWHASALLVIVMSFCCAPRAGKARACSRAAYVHHLPFVHYMLNSDSELCDFWNQTEWPCCVHDVECFIAEFENALAIFILTSTRV